MAASAVVFFLHTTVRMEVKFFVLKDFFATIVLVGTPKLKLIENLYRLRVYLIWDKLIAAVRTVSTVLKTSTFYTFATIERLAFFTSNWLLN